MKNSKDKELIEEFVKKVGIREVPPCLHKEEKDEVKVTIKGLILGVSRSPHRPKSGRLQY